MSHEINIRKNGVYILPTKGKYCDRDTALNVRIAGGEGGEVVLQDKSATPTKSQQTFTADDGYDGIGAFTVEPIPDEYIIPSGTKEITENGTHDVKQYESAEVNVPIPEGYIVPSGTIEITENGTYDVTDKASAVVNVPSGGNLVDYCGSWVGTYGQTETSITINVGVEIPETFFFFARCGTTSNTMFVPWQIVHSWDGSERAECVGISGQPQTVTVQNAVTVSSDRKRITLTPGNASWSGLVGGTWVWALVMEG